MRESKRRAHDSTPTSRNSNAPRHQRVTIVHLACVSRACSQEIAPGFVFRSQLRYPSVEYQYVVLSSQDTPYCLEEQIRCLDYKTQHVVLGRRFDTSYPIGGYNVSGDQSEQNTI
ncbi:hypothetical protein Tco_0744323 [Tanacetum coccineum]